MTGIAYEAWARELEQVSQQAGAEGLTCMEVATTLGKSEHGARQLLRKAIQAGLWECVGAKLVRSISGRLVPVPCYRPVDSTKAPR